MSKGSKASLGCLFWLALMLLIVVLFLLNQDNITALIQKIKGEDKSKPTQTTVVITRGGDTSSSATSQSFPASQGSSSSVASDQSSSSSNSSAKSSSSASLSSKSQSSVSKKNVKTLNLYFVSLGENDSIQLKPVTREIYYSDTPLTETLKALLAGPTPKEKQNSLQTLIPPGTQLTNVYIKGSTAYISFNENFRFNSYGLPGLEAQIKQIVYTATEFSNINQVQIMINDKKVDYLAQEGIYIGAPLKRDSL